MTHVITSPCLPENGCLNVYPVECITAGAPVEKWSTYYIDPKICIDCGACLPECPYSAIFPEEEAPSAFRVKGGGVMNRADLNGHYVGLGQRGEAIRLKSTSILVAGEVLELRDSIRLNQGFHR